MQWGNDNFFSLASFKSFYWWEKGKVGEKLVFYVFLNTDFISMSSSAVRHNKTNGGRWGRQVEIVLKVGEK